MIDGNVYIVSWSMNCAMGTDPDEISRKLLNGVPGRHIVHPQLHIPHFVLSDHDSRGNIHEAACELSLAEVRKAMREAFPQEEHPEKRWKIGCVAGTTSDVQFNDLDFFREWPDKVVHEEELQKFFSGTVAEKISRKLGFSGPAITISNTCVSGSEAVIQGSTLIKSGHCDAVVVLGVDLTSEMSLSGFYTLSAASLDVAKPFDASRSGMNVGEGVGCVILQSAGCCREYNHTARFRLCGGGSAGDAYHLTAPHPQGAGLQDAIRQALKQAELAPEDIAFVNAHGTGTLPNDSSEVYALAETIGKEVKYFSTKALTGHTFGAAGVIELIFCMICLREKTVPGSCNCAEPDKALQMAPVMAKTEISGRIAMSTNLAFGGNNTALIVEMAGE